MKSGNAIKLYRKSGGWRTSCGFPYGKPHTQETPVMSHSVDVAVG